MCAETRTVPAFDTGAHQTRRPFKRGAADVQTAERLSRIIAAETNAPELLGQMERDLQTALHEGQPYLRTADSPPVCISDVVENYTRLRKLLDTLTMSELWPCVVTQWKDALPFSAPLDVPPALAAMLIAQLRTVSAGDVPFPSAPAAPTQSAVAEASLKELALTQPYLVGATQRLIGLPKDRAEAGFIRGAKLDADARLPFSPVEPLDQRQEPPQARVSVETAMPNLTVVYTHGYFLSTLKQLGVSTPASASVAYGLYRFGIEVKGFHVFQESLVSVPDQLRISLSLVPQG
jgi:hypothetical protein